MKILKIVLIVIGILIAIPFIIALFVSRSYEVSRSVSVNKPKAEVFDYLKHVKNQDDYNAWVKMDPNIKKEFRGEDGKVGFVYAWESEKAGKGEQEITGIKEGEELDLQLRFKEPMEGLATATFYTEEVSPSETKVTWKMAGSSPYPFNFMNLFNGSMIGGAFEQGLSDIKSVLEK